MPAPTDPLAQALAILAGLPISGGRKRGAKRQKFQPITTTAVPTKPFLSPTSAPMPSGNPRQEYR